MDHILKHIGYITKSLMTIQQIRKVIVEITKELDVIEVRHALT